MRRSAYYLSGAVALTFLLAFIAGGCDALEGPSGGQGPQGPEGEQGPEGPQGPSGPGPNVVQFSFDANELQEADGSGNRMIYTESIAEIDSAVIDSGSVNAFMEQFENGQISNATVNFQNQNSTNGDQVTVSSAFLPHNGYIVIHDTTLQDGEALGSVIGVSEYLEPGSHEDVQISLYQNVPGRNFNQTSLDTNQTLIAMPHEETNNNQEYNFNTSDGSEDVPVEVSGEVLTDAAAVTIGSDAEITFDDQESGGQTVTIASTYVPRDGYVAIHDTSLQSGNTLGSVIGVSEYLEGDQTYTNLDVTLFEDFPGRDFPEDTTLQGDQPLIAMPHEETNDGVTSPTYDFVDTDGAQDIPYFIEDDDTNAPVTEEAQITVTSANGEAIANVNGNPNTSWVGLPLTFYVDTNNDDAADAEIDVNYTYDFGEVTIEFTSLNDQALDQLDGLFSVKAVVIPPDENSGGTDSNLFTGSAADSGTPKVHAYDELARKLNLTEEDVRIIEP